MAFMHDGSDAAPSGFGSWLVLLAGTGFVGLAAWFIDREHVWYWWKLFGAILAAITLLMIAGVYSSTKSSAPAPSPVQQPTTTTTTTRTTTASGRGDFDESPGIDADGD